jgi:hypothetical protein
VISPDVVQRFVQTRATKRTRRVPRFRRSEGCFALGRAIAPVAHPVLARVAHLVLAFAVVFGMVQSGGRYFYCEAVGLSPFDPCAEASGAAQGKCSRDTLGEPARDCCEVVTLAVTPRAARAAGPSIMPTPCVAVLPAIGLAGRTDGLARWGMDRAPGRWRTPPGASSDTRARLMVFLI